MSILVHVSTIIRNEAGELLFVREAKEVHRGKWNLPGGHVEIGEELTHAAIREVKEETGLEVSLTGLVGVYTGISAEIHSIRHVFVGTSCDPSLAAAGDEILEVRWCAARSIVSLPNRELVGAKYLRRIVSDFEAGRSFPLEVIVEVAGE